MIPLRQTLRLAPLLGAALALSAAPAGASVPGVEDVVTVENGDTFRGEVKGLERGNLKLDTDSAGVISIDWGDVLSVTTEAKFRVELTNGTIYYAVLVPAPAERQLSLDAERGDVVVDMVQVVRIGELEDSFWDRSSGYLSAGFSYTKASDVSQFNLSAGYAYTERDWRASVDLNAINTRQAEADTARKNDLTGKYTRFLGNRYLAYGQILFEQNSELGLDLRSSVLAAAGRYFVQTNSQLFSAQLGVGAEKEEGANGGTDDANITSLVGASYDLFITDSPTTALSAILNVIPYVSEFGRVRVNFDTSLRKEIISDFFWDLTYYARYDNEPPSVDASTTDWGIVTSFGYSF